MSERVTVQGKIGRSATTNPLDEGIDPYQSIGWTMRSGTGIVISQRAPLDLLCGNAMKKMTVPIPFAGSQSSTKRVMSPLSSTVPMKSVESCSHGAAGNIWCPAFPSIPPKKLQHPRSRRGCPRGGTGYCGGRVPGARAFANDAKIGWLRSEELPSWSKASGV